MCQGKGGLYKLFVQLFSKMTQNTDNQDLWGILVLVFGSVFGGFVAVWGFVPGLLVTPDSFPVQFIEATQTR